MVSQTETRQLRKNIRTNTQPEHESLMDALMSKRQQMNDMSPSNQNNQMDNQQTSTIDSFSQDRQYFRIGWHKHRTTTQKKPVNKARRQQQADITLLDKKLENLNRKQEQQTHQTNENWKEFSDVNYGFSDDGSSRVPSRQQQIREPEQVAAASQKNELSNSTDTHLSPMRKTPNSPIIRPQTSDKIEKQTIVPEETKAVVPEETKTVVPEETQKRRDSVYREEPLKSLVEPSPIREQSVHSEKMVQAEESLKPSSKTNERAESVHHETIPQQEPVQRSLSATKQPPIERVEPNHDKSSPILEKNITLPNKTNELEDDNQKFKLPQINSNSLPNTSRRPSYTNQSYFPEPAHLNTDTMSPTSQSLPSINTISLPTREPFPISLPPRTLKTIQPNTVLPTVHRGLQSIQRSMDRYRFHVW
ncbi:unnamed protein product [Didymodactylos carnosus]|uniref:Uncharacterized protein n=1 Tax=Didymodactylos carnosus TaxID=1234261 RepID=A0A815LTR2_9BILA|nr:unnamed protein product [Didymodactylos carnosus]CAF4300573.1 unnamed protein product [Didymodactylos carnosus]